MTSPIGIQLYSVREALSQDYEGTIRRIAAMGYAGVETAGSFGASVASAAALYRSLGLKVMAMHAPLPVGEKKNQVLETAAALECKQLVCAWMPPERFQSVESIQKLCDELNDANTVAQANGLALAYHNHDFEFAPLPDGSIPHEHMAKFLAPSISFEIDMYWVKAAGSDPAAVIRRLGKRVPLLHVKDGPAKRGVPMQALGEGVVDLPAAIKAGEGNTQWLIVELDVCATDIFEAVEKSYKYLASKGFGHGK